MSERIRYAWGSSSLGDYIAAASDDGLVAFEFGEQGPAMVDTLRMRFPDAKIVDDRRGLSDMVGKLEHLVDHPDQDPGIILDMRGSDYQKQVWTMLREIPAGETTNYGSLAAKLETRDARDVTEAIGSNAIAILIPCHRVIKKDGSISGYRWGVRRKRILLQRERRTELFQEALRHDVGQMRARAGRLCRGASLSRQLWQGQRANIAVPRHCRSGARETAVPAYHLTQFVIA